MRYLLSLLFVLLVFCVGENDVWGESQKPISRFIRLQSPWLKEEAPDSSFEISVDGPRLTIRGDVVDADVIGPLESDRASDEQNTDSILFAWSRSPLALDFEAVQIFPGGQCKILRQDSSKEEIELAHQFQPELRVTKTSSGYRFECDIVRTKAGTITAANNESLYVSLLQIDATRDGKESRWYCSSIPTTLKPERFSASSFALLDSFPSEKRDGLVTTESTNRSFRMAELELRNKWSQYVSRPSVLNRTQRWYDDIAGFPDAERFLERTVEGNQLQGLSSIDGQNPMRTADARSEEIRHLLGQNWSVHLGRFEDLGTCLPLTVSVSESGGDETQTESLAMWLQSDRLHVALLQNGQGAYWGTASWPVQHAETSRVKSITITFDGSTNGVGLELYANSKPLELVTHNATNLRPLIDIPPFSGRQMRLSTGHWNIEAATSDLQIDLYNTNLTPIEVLSLDSGATLLSWSELSEEDREAWLLHYVFCIDPEGRYYSESLKHYTSGQAELLRRSRKPAKK